MIKKDKACSTFLIHSYLPSLWWLLSGKIENISLYCGKIMIVSYQMCHISFHHHVSLSTRAIGAHLVSI